MRTRDDDRYYGSRIARDDGDEEEEDFFAGFAGVGSFGSVRARSNRRNEFVMIPSAP